jgi:hypothetical protein
MIQAADVREWRSYDVVDPDGHKIGTLDAVYVNTRTDEPAMTTVQIVLPTSPGRKGSGSSPVADARRLAPIRSARGHGFVMMASQRRAAWPGHDEGETACSYGTTIRDRHSWHPWPSNRRGPRCSSCTVAARRGRKRCLG